MQSSNGKIYGLTKGGGLYIDGVVFDYDISSNTLTKRVDLDSLTGQNPTHGLMEASNGKLYGLAEWGGPSQSGTLFEYDTTSNSITYVLDFGSSGNSISPEGNLMEASNGKLYGNTFYGNGDGDLFEFDYVNHIYTLKVDLSPTLDAGEPHNPVLLELAAPNTEYVWPGDCNADLIVDNFDFLYIGMAYNDTETIRNCASTDWFAQQSFNWINSFPNGVNHHHADANGDAWVNMNDTAAIYLNYGMSHPPRLHYPDHTNTLPDIYLVPDHTSVTAGDTIHYEIRLASSATPIDSLYGIAYTLSFDPSLADTTSFRIQYNTSVLGNISTYMISFEKDFLSSGSTDAAVVRTDLQNVTGVYGVLGTFSVITSSTVAAPSQFIMSPSNIRGITIGGTAVSLNAIPDTVLVNPLPTGINYGSHSNDLVLFPNPANRQVTLVLKNKQIDDISIYDSEGRSVYRVTPSGDYLIIPASGFAEGIYFIEATGKEKVFHAKLRILR